MASWVGSGLEGELFNACALQSLILVLNVVSLGGFLFVLSRPCFPSCSGPLLGSCFLFLGCQICQLFFCTFSKIAKCLGHVIGEEELLKYLEDIKSSKPQIRIGIRYYNYWQSESDNQKDSQHTSLKASMEYAMGEWDDSTKSLEEMVPSSSSSRKKRFLQVEFVLQCNPRDHATSQDFERVKNEFYQSQNQFYESIKTRANEKEAKWVSYNLFMPGSKKFKKIKEDEDMHSTVGPNNEVGPDGGEKESKALYDMTGYDFEGTGQYKPCKTVILSHDGSAQKPWWMDWRVFYLACFLWCYFPYKWFFDCSTLSLTWEVMKTYTAARSAGTNTIAGGSMMNVQVPTGSNPGDKVAVQAPNGQTMEAVVPEGAKPGSVIQVCLPIALIAVPITVAAPAVPAEPLSMQVQIPTGSMPGEKVKFQAPNGQTIEALVPENALTGSVMEVDLQTFESKVVPTTYGVTV